MENLPEVSRATIASVLGYTSIGFWLFAQAPQVVKNARLRSCEGLALPFLCNWLFGDITNLIGCILTDQLPFQTYLAAYFCVIDFTLVGQFFYYRPPRTTPTYRSSSNYTTSPHQSLVIHTAPIPHSHGPHHPHPNSRSQQLAPHSRARSSSSVPHKPVPPLSASTTSTVRPGINRASQSFAHPGEASTSTHSSIYRGRERSAPGSSGQQLVRDGSYAAIYEAALDVARAAERAEYHRQTSQSRSRTRRARVPSHRPSVNSAMPDLEEDIRSPPLPNRSAMFDSFHSDMSALTDTSGTSSSAAAERQRNMSSSTPGLLDRGRSLVRTATGLGTEEEGGDMISGLPGEGGRGMVQMRETRSRSKSRGVSMARATSGRGSGRRAAGVAFMSLGMLAGWNGLGRGAKLRESRPAGMEGRVLLRPHAGLDEMGRSAIHPLPVLSSPLLVDLPSAAASPDTTYILVEHPSAHDHPPPPEDEPPDYQRIIGRISAWACTTLYLTSRLPQIWKNFERKSVEGLSILLFLFAFCGNTAYVASIIYNPAASLESPEANQYLLEALPYLLGSGGTLLFDLTIITQSLLYGSAPPVPQTTLERSSFRKPLFRRRLRLAEEGRGVSGSGTFGERQPLLSGSMVTVGGGSRRHHQYQQQYSGPQSVPMGEGESRTRSVSADVQLGEGSAWREAAGGGGVIAGLKRVEEPVDEPEEEE